MPTYRFCLIATDSRAGKVYVMEVDSDDKACELASELLLESAFPIIEVWRARAMIYRVSKVDPDQPDRRPPAPSATSRAQGAHAAALGVGNSAAGKSPGLFTRLRQRK